MRIGRVPLNRHGSFVQTEVGSWMQNGQAANLAEYRCVESVQRFFARDECLHVESMIESCEERIGRERRNNRGSAPYAGEDFWRGAETEYLEINRGEWIRRHEFDSTQVSSEPIYHYTLFCKNRAAR